MLTIENDSSTIIFFGLSDGRSEYLFFLLLEQFDYLWWGEAVFHIILSLNNLYIILAKIISIALLMTSVMYI